MPLNTAILLVHGHVCTYWHEQLCLLSEKPICRMRTDQSERVKMFLPRKCLDDGLSGPVCCEPARLTVHGFTLGIGASINFLFSLPSFNASSVAFSIEQAFSSLISGFLGEITWQGGPLFCESLVVSLWLPFAEGESTVVDSVRVAMIILRLNQLPWLTRVDSN